jgi:osmotically-inducible protein OsmY
MLNSQAVLTGLSLERNEKLNEDSQNAKILADLKDGSRMNTTGIDNDLAIDIQDALGRETSLSGVLDNIDVTVEREIVTLRGEVDTVREITTAGDIAIVLAGDDNLNNFLSIK